MKTPAQISAAPYRLDESEDILGVVRTLIDGTRPGILATLDGKGFPRMRWMSSLACGEFPNLYTLTASTSRKIDHLRDHPRVTWMFFNIDLSLVVTLIGRADVLEDRKALAHVWNHVTDKQHAYFLRNCTNGPSTAVIRTRIERVECTTPENYMHFDVPPSEVIGKARALKQMKARSRRHE